MRHRTKKRGHAWTLTEDQYAAALGEGACHYCEQLIDTGGVSLDRMDSTKGYDAGNVVACCFTCNVEKGRSITYEEYVWLWKFRRAKASAMAKVASLHSTPATRVKAKLPPTKIEAGWREALRERAEKRACGLAVDAPWPAAPVDETVAQWRARLGITQRQAARLLEVVGRGRRWSYRSVQRNEKTR